MVKQSAALAAIIKVLWQPVYSRGAPGSCFYSACMRFLEIMLFCLSLLRGAMLLVCVAGCVHTRLLFILFYFDIAVNYHSDIINLKVPSSYYWILNTHFAGFKSSLSLCDTLLKEFSFAQTPIRKRIKLWL